LIFWDCAPPLKSALDVYHLIRVPGASLKLNTTQVSTASQVPCFNAHQNPHLDIPACFVCQEKARELKKEGTHYFAGHSLFGYSGVKAIVELPQQALPKYIQEQREESEFSGWSVVGQTARPFSRKSRVGPGAPGWELVH
jgi:hypothetical protein